MPTIFRTCLFFLIYWNMPLAVQA
uniref:Uncharacterized protein n=1 Tax=Rhizophora mucronata TaxID=61149 RepID=A0A2P2IZW8_RHIMU